MSNINVKNAISLVRSIKKLIDSAKANGKNSVNVPYDYWYEDAYVGELAFRYFNSIKMPMMVHSDYVDGEPVGKSINIIFNLNPAFAV